jgi:hypothetical protein
MRGSRVALVVLGVLFLVSGVIVQFGHVPPFVAIRYIGVVLLGFGVIFVLSAAALTRMSGRLPIETGER